MTINTLWTCGMFVCAVIAVLRLAAWMRCECLFTAGACRYRCGSWGWQAVIFGALATLCHYAPALSQWLSWHLHV